MSTQQPKGRWVYSWEYSKYFIIDEQDRIIDPDVARIPIPANLGNVTAPIQRKVAPAAPIQRNAASARTRRTVSPAPVQRNVAPAQRPAPVQQRNVAPRPVPRTAVLATFNLSGGRIVQQTNTTIPVPANFAQTFAAPNTRTQRVAPRRNRSASVSSSGSTRSVSSKRSTTSKKNTAPQKYQKVYLNRAAVVRKCPSLNTRVIENLEEDAEIFVDTSSIMNIWYNDNLRKRIKVVEEHEFRGWITKGWVTVETEKGRLYRKTRASFKSSGW